jgi:indolepyruvate ferredoxin oxidoreductase, beta subunit
MNIGNINILICGVGGQGILLAGEILSAVALESGFDVKKSEVHGMAQRGGSVVSHVRFGEKIYSPLISEGEADFIFSFEKMETLRYLPMLKKDGIIIINDQKISPTSISIKSDKYPENITDTCRKYAREVILIDAMQIASKLGNSKTVNVIMLGALSGFLNLQDELWIKCIKTAVKPKFLELNLKAFQEGRNTVK